MSLELGDLPARYDALLAELAASQRARAVAEDEVEDLRRRLRDAEDNEKKQRVVCDRRGAELKACRDRIVHLEYLLAQLRARLELLEEDGGTIFVVRAVGAG